MLVLAREIDQEVWIGFEQPLVRVKVLRIQGLAKLQPSVQLGLAAPAGITMHRAEYVERSGWTVRRPDSTDHMAQVQPYAGRPDLLVLAFRDAAAATAARRAGFAQFHPVCQPTLESNA